MQGQGCDMADKDTEPIVHETSGIAPAPEPASTTSDAPAAAKPDAGKPSHEQEHEDRDVKNEKKEAAEQAAYEGSDAAARLRKKRHYTIGDIKDFAPHKRRMFYKWFWGSIALAIILLAYMSVSLYNDGIQEKSTWWENNVPTYTANLDEAQSKAAAHDAVHVKVGTYIETFRNVSIKNSNYEVTMLVWFRWSGHENLDMANNFTVYKGLINKKEVLSQSTVGDEHYQLVRMDVTLNKVFYTSRFPLESHQLRIFIESEYDATEVIFDGDTENSTINSAATIAGYNVKNVQFAETAHTYPSTESDPTLVYPTTDSEYMTAITIGRAGFGLYLKCFIAMYGTTLWVLIMLYICGHYRVDPLGMIPGALFGTVSNIMVGAALLPDALDLGLLEFVNIWGILTIVAVAVYIIQINNIRSEYGRKDEAFSKFFGRAMFYIALVFAVSGNILLPAIAYFGA